MKINLMPLYSKLSDGRKTQGLSSHQKATWDALKDPNVDAVINMAATGDGKSYAAYGAFPEGQVIGLYPTNELVRDQERQLSTYEHDWSVRRVTGFDLDKWSREEKVSKAEILGDLAQSDILLTNPDLFYYLHNGNYTKAYLANGDDPTGLWELIDKKFKAIVFDEFHLYSPSQVSGILNTILLMRSCGIFHKYIFLSATPNPYLIKALALAGVRTKVVNPTAQNWYSEKSGRGWREINQPTELEFIGKERGFDWIVENRQQILSFFLENKGSKGAIILNSVASVKRLVRTLEKDFAEHGLMVAENTGFTDAEDAAIAIKADLIIGTSTLDVGVDFRINYLIFEGHDAPTFLQRLGRIGRHKGFPCYQAIAFVPLYVLERMELYCPEYATRQEFTEIINKQHSQTNSFKRYYRRWSPVQALIVGQQLQGCQPEKFKKYLAAAQQLWGEDLRNVVAQCKAWGEESAQLRTSNLVVKEARAFRGTSPLQCAVIMPNGRPATYNLPSILSNYSFEFVDKKSFPRWFKAANYCEIHLKVTGLLEYRNQWRFFLPEWKAKNRAGRLSISNGFSTVDRHQCDPMRRQIDHIPLVAFIVEARADDLKRSLRLPLHFPLYDLQTQVIEYHTIYSVAFGQSALILDAYLGQGKQVIERDMVRHHCKQILKEDYDEDDKFLRAFAQGISHYDMVESWQS